jgi:hypothetical protein
MGKMGKDSGRLTLTQMETYVTGNNLTGNSSCNGYCNCLIVDRFGIDPKLMDENLIDRLHQPLTKTIPHYLNKLRSIDQSINDMQHITESCICNFIY